MNCRDVGTQGGGAATDFSRTKKPSELRTLLLRFFSSICSVAPIPVSHTHGMEESDVDVRVSMLALHLGALYSCPAELPLTESKSSNTCGATPSSALCLLPEELQRSSSRGSQVDPTDGSLSSAEDTPDSASGPVREVFCRVLPHSPAGPPAADATAGLKTANRNDDDGYQDTLSEALGLMYGGVHVAHSPQPSTIGAAGPGAREEGGTAEEKAARPPPSSSTPHLHLVPCTRLHAGLVQLYAPVVESADGTFLVRRLRELLL